MTAGHLCFSFYWLKLFPFPTYFLKTNLFCDEQWSCFVLYLFDFWKKKKLFIVVQILYLHLVVQGSDGTTVGRNTGWASFHFFPYLAHFVPKAVSLRSNTTEPSSLVKQQHLRLSRVRHILRAVATSLVFTMETANWCFGCGGLSYDLFLVKNQAILLFKTYLV